MIWIHILIWLVAIPIQASYRMFLFMPELPAGIVLDKNAVLPLHQLVKDQLRHYRSTRNNCVELSKDLEFDIHGSCQAG
ncbi:MAG: hypothetical protein ABFS45_24000 [Pseudomonadota bacterium]